MIASPTAASGVSHGLIRVAEGKISPTAPASSAKPMNRASPAGIPVIHGDVFAAACWLGVVALSALGARRAEGTGDGGDE